VRALRDRNAELFRLYSGMNGAMDRIFADYDDTQLELLADFPAPLHRRGKEHHRRLVRYSVTTISGRLSTSRGWRGLPAPGPLYESCTARTYRSPGSQQGIPTRTEKHLCSFA
jgi:hypothetical protein